MIDYLLTITLYPEKGHGKPRTKTFVNFRGLPNETLKDGGQSCDVLAGSGGDLEGQSSCRSRIEVLAEHRDYHLTVALCRTIHDFAADRLLERSLHIENRKRLRPEFNEGRRDSQQRDYRETRDSQRQADHCLAAASVRGFVKQRFWKYRSSNARTGITVLSLAGVHGYILFIVPCIDLRSSEVKSRSCRRSTGRLLHCMHIVVM